MVNGMAMLATMLMAIAYIKAEEMGRKNRRRRDKGHKSGFVSNGGGGFDALDRKAKQLEAKQRKKERKKQRHNKQNEPTHSPYANLNMPEEVEVPVWDGD